MGLGTKNWGKSHLRMLIWGLMDSLDCEDLGYPLFRQGKISKLSEM